MHAHALSTTRTARYYTLGGEDSVPDPAPVSSVWMVLHGYGQAATYFLRGFERMAAPGRLIVAPEALSRFCTDGTGGPHERVGASWMTRESREAEIADYVRYLDGVLAATCASTDTVRLVVLGFSQGAATAARWLALSPRLAARQPRADRLVLWGADLPHDLDLAAARPWLSAAALTLVVGDADAYTTPERVAAAEARLRAAEVPYRLVRFPGGHRIAPDVLEALADA